MDEIIRQLETVILEKNKIGPEQAKGCAFKELVLSGMSRAGVLKDFCYLPDLDRFENGTYCIAFLNQNDQEKIPYKECLSVVKNELSAFGVDSGITDTGNGFSIAFDENKLVVYIYTKQFHLKPVYKYIQTPLAFELISIESMNESIKEEIRLQMEKDVFPEPKTKKEGASKAPRKNKTKKEPDNHWVQPSLFDF